MIENGDKFKCTLPNDIPMVVREFCAIEIRFWNKFISTASIAILKKNWRLEMNKYSFKFEVGAKKYGKLSKILIEPKTFWFY